MFVCNSARYIRSDPHPLKVTCCDYDCDMAPGFWGGGNLNCTLYERKCIALERASAEVKFRMKVGRFSPQIRTYQEKVDKLKAGYDACRKKFAPGASPNQGAGLCLGMCSFVESKSWDPSDKVAGFAGHGLEDPLDVLHAQSCFSWQLLVCS